MGTPTDQNWPDALKLPDFKPSFPKWKGIPMSEHVTNMDECAVDLLVGMTALDPNKRISARMALLHPYFDNMDRSKLPIQYWPYKKRKKLTRTILFLY